MAGERVRAELRHRGLIVNHKKIRRLVREHDLQPRRRRRHVATTDSDHDQPIYPNRAKDMTINGPNQLGVADITYVAIVDGFAYVAVILDALVRRTVGYAIRRSIDFRLTLAALNAAIEQRNPPPGCVHHTDRGSQYAAQGYREALLRHGLVGSMGRRGNPYDNKKAESFMKALKVEAVYPMAYETFADVAHDLPRFIDEVYNARRLHPRWAISARNSSRIVTPGPWSNQQPDSWVRTSHWRPPARLTVQSGVGPWGGTHDRLII
jgi:putative transposase